MKTYRMLLGRVAAVLSGLFLSGCVEQSTVIKVARDGSGVVHLRQYKASTDSLISFSGADKKKSKDDKKPEDEVKLPNKADLDAYATKLGEGVTLSSVKSSKNKNGWPGYEIVYAFKDINSLRYDGTLSEAKSKKKKNGESDKGSGDKFEVVFEMKDGVLSFRLDRDGMDEVAETAAPAKPDDSPTTNPFADTEGVEAAEISLSSPWANEAMLKAATKGMRVGLFVEIDGEIAETNAAHQTGNLITLLSADLGKIFEQPGATRAMEQMEDANREQLRKLADETDGLDIDLQEPVTVTFKEEGGNK